MRSNNKKHIDTFYKDHTVMQSWLVLYATLLQTGVRGYRMQAETGNRAKCKVFFKLNIQWCLKCCEPFRVSSYFCIKLSNITYQWVAKVCAPLVLADHLEVRLESGVFKQWDDNQMLSGCPDLFKEWGSIKVWSSQQVYRRLLRTKGYKTSLKSLNSTNPQSDR